MLPISPPPSDAPLKRKDDSAQDDATSRRVSSLHTGGDLAALRERVLAKGSNPTDLKGDLPLAEVVTEKPSAPANSQNSPEPSFEGNLYTQKPLPPTPQGDAPIKTISGVRPVRTFRDDVAQVVERRKISLVSAIAAEEDRRSDDKVNSQPSQIKISSFSPGAYFLLGVSTVLCLVGVGIFAGYYVFFAPEEQVGVASTTLPSLIFTELQTQLDVTGMRRRELLDALGAEKDRARIRLGAITTIYPIIRATHTWELMTSEQFFAALESHTPAVLQRTMTPFFTLGVHEFDGNEPFLLLRVGSYESAFAGMLEWEPSLNTDLSPFFGRVSLIRKLAPIGNAGLPTNTLPYFLDTTISSTSTTNATSTYATTTPRQDDPAGELPPTSPRASTISFAPLRFTDTVVRNKEVRVLRSGEGQIVLLYAFLDPATIVITTNEHTFIEVLTRYSSQR